MSGLATHPPISKFQKMTKLKRFYIFISIVTMSHIEAIGFIKKWVVSLTIHAEDFKADMQPFKGL